VRAIALAVIEAPNKRLRAVRGPQRLVVEHGRVPHGLIRHLWHSDGVRGRASSCRDETSLHGAVHVVLVVGTVEVLAVPARGEMVDGHDASRAGVLREVVGLATASVDVPETCITEPRVLAVLDCGAADSHAETLSGH